MKKLSFLFGLAVVFTVAMSFTGNIEESKKAFNFKSSHNVEGKLISDDAGLYCSFKGKDHNGNDVEFSCWFCNCDDFAEKALEHLKKLEKED